MKTWSQCHVPLHQSGEVPVQPPNIQLVPIHMLSAFNMGTIGQGTCYCGASDMLLWS